MGRYFWVGRQVRTLRRYNRGYLLLPPLMYAPIIIFQLNLWFFLLETLILFSKRAPALFRKLEKSAQLLEKNALIVVIYGLNFSFKMQVLRVSRRKNQRFNWNIIVVCYLAVQLAKVDLISRPNQSDLVMNFYV